MTSSPLDIHHFDYPEWVNWIAQDENGSWWGFSVEPLQYDHGWYENEAGNYTLLKKGPAEKNWQHSLKKIQSGTRKI